MRIVPQIGNLRKRNRLPTCCTRKPADESKQEVKEKENPADGKASKRREKPEEAEQVPWERSRKKKMHIIFMFTFFLFSGEKKEAKKTRRRKS